MRQLVLALLALAPALAGAHSIEPGTLQLSGGSFDAGLAYQTLTLEDDAGTEVDASGFTVGLGLSVYLGGR
jgi:hypothetical protein